MQAILLKSGIESSTLVLLLMLPVVATLIGFARHILGLRSLGIYLSIVMTFIFFRLGASSSGYDSNPWTGLMYGLPLIFVIFFATAVFYRMIRGFALSYYPKLTIVITLVTTFLIALIILSGLLGIPYLIQINTFILILIVITCERYLTLFSRKSLKAAVFITLESIIWAVICYLIISLNYVQNLLLTYPYIILLILPVNYIIGKFSGLRLSEYFRFWSILTEED
jgi:hypothetical protein